MKFKAFLGYTAAILCTIIVIATFGGMKFWSEALVSATGVSISPWYNGGRIIKTIDHGDYKTEIHEPVFQGLFKPRKKGFIQVDWIRTRKIPDKIGEGIDIEGDGKIDFVVEYNTGTNTATITPLSPPVIALEKTYRLKDGFAVRVWLKNQGR